jgi:hypothetical protein
VSWTSVVCIFLLLVTAGIEFDPHAEYARPTGAERSSGTEQAPADFYRICLAKEFSFLSYIYLTLTTSRKGRKCSDSETSVRDRTLFPAKQLCTSRKNWIFGRIGRTYQPVRHQLT